MRLAACVIVLASSAAFAADEDRIENPRLPRLWKVVQRTQIPTAQVEGLAKKLGAALISIERDVLDAGGVRVQVNIARCADEKAAEALEKKFTEIHGGDELYAVRRGVDVAEIVCGNRFVARRARHVLGWDKDARWVGPAYFKATMQVAPLERSDGMRWNRLFNLLTVADDPKNAAAIEEAAKAFTFADRLPWTKPDEPAPPRVHGIPRLEITVSDVVPVFTSGTAPKDVSTWTASTEFWPTAAPEVVAAARAALGESPPKSARERTELVLGWVHENVRYGGDVTGSRYGTTTVLAQGFGHCWDQSDVFVTLCRAAGVPARQVGGWLKGGGGGHVWAEVVLEDGLWAVDPGTTWLGVSEDYVCLWTSDDGRTLYVYWGPPKITELACIK